MRHLDAVEYHDAGATIDGSFMFKFGELRVITTGQRVMDYVAPVSKNECDDYDINSQTKLFKLSFCNDDHFIFINWFY